MPPLARVLGRVCGRPPVLVRRASGLESIDLCVLYRNYPPVPLAELVDCADEQVSLGQVLVLGGWGDVAGLQGAGLHGDEARA
jgi:hypothetical protein